MEGRDEIIVSRILDTADWGFILPSGFSFFEPYLRFYVKEILEVGGEAYVSRDAGGNVSGIFIYDEIEMNGTIFTGSREVFDHFYGMKPVGSFFAELRTENQAEVYDVYTRNLDGLSLVHTFSHEVSIAEEAETSELERFMVSAYQGMNRRWVRVALENGEKCVLVRLGDEIAGLGWASITNGVGRLHSLFVRPQLRGMGIGMDILQARLLWLKSRGARWAFSEISRDNAASSRIAVKGRMSVSGQIYLCHKKNVAGPTGVKV